jgi:Fe-S-cluster-containing hydrogenase component 2
MHEGLRFDDFLVATSCRSCKDAYLHEWQDAIHPGRHQQIVIEDHCVGLQPVHAELPNGNTFMEPDTKPGQPHKSRLKAATCDSCDAAWLENIPTPRCVYACPRDAPHRVTGPDLLKMVNQSQGRS